MRRAGKTKAAVECGVGRRAFGGGPAAGVAICGRGGPTRHAGAGHRYRRRFSRRRCCTPARFPVVYRMIPAAASLAEFLSTASVLGGSILPRVLVRKVYPEFAATHRVIALDLIGFGESARPNVQLGAADYVRILAEFIRATCRDTPPILIGSGLGAGFCIYLASQHPEMVSRLILLTPTGLNNFGKKETARWVPGSSAVCRC